jgi:hypothetical protein
MIASPKSRTIPCCTDYLLLTRDLWWFLIFHTSMEVICAFSAYSAWLNLRFWFIHSHTTIVTHLEIIPDSLDHSRNFESGARALADCFCNQHSLGCLWSLSHLSALHASGQLYRQKKRQAHMLATNAFLRRRFRDFEKATFPIRYYGHTAICGQSCAAWHKRSVAGHVISTDCENTTSTCVAQWIELWNIAITLIKNLNDTALHSF